MTNRELRMLPLGAGAMSAAVLLLELVAFRLGAVVMPAGFAAFVALTSGGMVASGALLLRHRSARSSGPQLARRASQFAAIAAVCAAFGAIGFAWISHRLAILKADDSIPYFALALLVFWAPAWFSGAALGAAMRCGGALIGRMGYAEGLGAALLALLAGIVLEMLGAPLALLVAGVLMGLSALAFAMAAGASAPNGSVLVTVPLAVLVLMAGDLGAPWLKVRTDTGRRTKIGLSAWTPEALIAVQRVSHGKTRLRVERGPDIPLAQAPRGRRKPRFLSQDLAFVDRGGRDGRGPVLVVGSTGGREARVALAHGHPRVDMLEFQGRVVNGLLGEKYADVTGYLLSDAEHVRVQVGSGLAALATLNNDYERIVVLSQGKLRQAGPRLLMADDRLFSREAVRDYLSRLRPDGSLSLQLPSAALPSAVAAATEALGVPPKEALTRMVACSGKDGLSLLLVYRRPLTSALARKITSRCTKTRMTVQTPLDPVKRGRREHDKVAQDQAATRAKLLAGHAIADDRPFFGGPPTIGSLASAALSSLSALRPRVEAKPPRKRAKKDSKNKSKEAEPEPPPAPEMTASGTAAAALGLLALLALLGLLVRLPRRRAGNAAELLSCSRAMRLSLPLLGMAAALCLFSVGDVLLRLGGDAAFGWAVVVPLGAVGVGAGKLCADVGPLGQRLRQRWLVLVGAVAVLGAMVLGLSPWLSARIPLGGDLLVVGVVGLLVVGAASGYAIALAMRILHAVEPAWLAWCWGAQHLGWAIGGAIAALAVHLVGVLQLGFFGVGCAALGLVLFTGGVRKSLPN